MIIHELSFKLKMKNRSKKGMMKLLMVEDAAQEYRIKGTHFMSSMQIEWVGSKDFLLIGLPATSSKKKKINNPVWIFMLDFEVE